MTEAAAFAAAAGVGFGHAVLPDHWVPLAVLGRTRRYPLRRVARLSALAGITHVAVSVLLGAVVVVVGLQFRHMVEHVQAALVGGLLIATAVLFVAWELSGRGHSHGHAHGHDHGEHGHGEHDHGEHDHGEHHHGEHEHEHRLLAIIIPFGAAASPDLTILPVFLAATAAGTAAAIGSLVAFAVVTVSTIVTLTLAAALGGYQVRVAWLDRWGNVFTAAVLVIIGVLVAAGVL
ncbi:MAG TPA: hypothetical protein VE992_06955 [Solirubrobacteraceae bacterium]|nr:hypothetical protein [Solirubrobacteraceae bacterium]